MDFRRSLAAAVICMALTGCGSKPYSTAYNLGFEYTADGRLPLQWGIPDAPYHGYATSLDFSRRQHGKASLHLTQTDPAKSGWAIFWLMLPPELVAGHEVELSGWISTQDVSEGFADVYLTEYEKIDYNELILDTPGRGVRNTADWTRVAVKKQISGGTSGVMIGGILKGPGGAWFDSLELTIDGEPFRDTLVAAPKTRLTREDKRELRKYIHPLRTGDAGTGDTNDLKVLDELVGNSRVVALGENSHGSGEIYRMKNRMVRYLVENRGFNIFSIEAYMPESYRFNEYIRDGQGDAESRVRGQEFWIWKTQEMLDLVKWMRQFNQSGQSERKIVYTGFDMQSYDISVDVLKSAFKDDEQAERLLQDMHAELKDVLAYTSVGSPLIDRTLAGNIARGLSQIEERIGKLPVGETERAWLRQNATLLRQYLGQGHFFWRDRCMAENLLWIERQNPASRIVIWAHNGHIGKSGAGMGGILKESLDADYVNFGFTFGSGKYTAFRPGSDKWIHDAQPAGPGTLEYLLGKLAEPLFILDLKRMRAEGSPALGWIDKLQFRHVGAVKIENEFPDRKVSDEFDYLVYMRKTGPSHLL